MKRRATGSGINRSNETQGPSLLDCKNVAVGRDLKYVTPALRKFARIYGPKWQDHMASARDGDVMEPADGKRGLMVSMSELRTSVINHLTRSVEPRTPEGASPARRPTAAAVSFTVKSDMPLPLLLLMQSGDRDD